MYSGCNKLSRLQILFVYFLTLPSLLHPSSYLYNMEWSYLAYSCLQVCRWMLLGDRSGNCNCSSYGFFFQHWTSKQHFCNSNAELLAQNGDESTAVIANEVQNYKNLQQNNAALISKLGKQSKHACTSWQCIATPTRELKLMQHTLMQHQDRVLNSLFDNWLDILVVHFVVSWKPLLHEAPHTYSTGWHMQQICTYIWRGI